ncbi:hypothetical protein [Paludisphaera soli]|uniref:hypothetical protein n=1 Tax=Paludisphaera soli TaxID=2712865 RepID=UPI0013ECC814|nr:hypothetical protein [Paludisphaera soli]
MRTRLVRWWSNPATRLSQVVVHPVAAEGDPTEAVTFPGVAHDLQPAADSTSKLDAAAGVRWTAMYQGVLNGEDLQGSARHP